MQNAITEPTIVAFVISRGEGRADDGWPVGETRVYTGYTRQMHDDLTGAARDLTHPGYDKFDVEVVYSNGRRTQHRLDLDSAFSDLRNYIDVL
jgi:hypothetical protein